MFYGWGPDDEIPFLYEGCFYFFLIIGVFQQYGLVGKFYCEVTVLAVGVSSQARGGSRLVGVEDLVLR
jgi:hypothetical protein